MHVLIVILVIALIAAIIYWPSIWVRQVLAKYSQPDDLFPGTGGELARHLLAQFEIHGVGVEETEPGQDHYDPVARMVRLSPDHFQGKSLTAITIAAHEVGHAIQHATGYAPFRLRHALVHVANAAEKVGTIAIMAMPIIALAARSPAAGAAAFMLGLAGIALGALVHLVTLPVEWNASFGRALPILTAGEYVSESQSWHARRILKAAALTYVAGSLASLLNFYRWIMILRR